jgi:hypothetical protein
LHPDLAFNANARPLHFNEKCLSGKIT